MALYRIPEYGMLSVLSHIPTYGLNVIQLTSETVNDEFVYTLEINGEIPNEELPHLIEGCGLEVL